MIKSIQSLATVLTPQTFPTIQTALAYKSQLNNLGIKAFIQTVPADGESII